MAKRNAKKESKSRLVLFEPRGNGEQAYNFIIGLTADMVEAIIDAYENGEIDQYGVIVKLGGAVYENDNNIAGTVYLREEEEEAPKRKSLTKRRSRDDDDDDDEEEPPKARTKRKNTRLR